LTGKLVCYSNSNIPDSELDLGLIPLLTLTPTLIVISFFIFISKVRVKSIISSICSSEMPHDNITDFLITLIEEGNYFPRDFLWDCETKNLEFNR
jgi:hypothetical protein